MTTRILIIDDEEHARYLLSRMLEQTGIDLAVEEARDGSLGLEMFKRAPFDVVITDVFMPDTEGLETIGELRRIAPGVKIIAISGGGDFLIGTDVLLAAKRIGADATLSKPFTVGDLKTALTELLRTE